jgi:hypothetical protein
VQRQAHPWEARLHALAEWIQKNKRHLMNCWLWLFCRIHTYPFFHMTCAFIIILPCMLTYRYQACYQLLQLGNMLGTSMLPVANLTGYLLVTWARYRLSYPEVPNVTKSVTTLCYQVVPWVTKAVTWSVTEMVPSRCALSLPSGNIGRYQFVTAPW